MVFEFGFFCFYEMGIDELTEQIVNIKFLVKLVKKLLAKILEMFNSFYHFEENNSFEVN